MSLDLRHFQQWALCPRQAEPAETGRAIKSLRQLFPASAEFSLLEFGHNWDTRRDTIVFFRFLVKGKCREIGGFSRMIFKLGCFVQDCAPFKQRVNHNRLRV